MKITNLYYLVLLESLLLLLVSCGDTKDIKHHMSSGLNAYAYPIKQISIDGDLSDWPNDIQKHSLNQLNGDKTDTNAFFQVAYIKRENSLVIAVVYHDTDRIVVDSISWDSQDSYSFYIDEEHRVYGSGVNRYTFNNVLTNNSNPEISWDPKCLDYFDWNKVERKTEVNGNQVVIELKYKLSNPITVGRSVGVNHMIVDMDSIDQRPIYHTWIRNRYSEKTNGRMGSLIFVDENTEFTSMSGVLRLDKDLKKFPKNLIVSAEGEISRWMKISVDSSGRFQTTIPSGSYKLSLHNELISKSGGYTKIFLDPSRIAINLEAKDSLVLDVPVASIELPDLLPKQGILQDGFQEDDKQIIDDFVRAYQEYYSIPGVSIAVISNGEIVYDKSYGFQNMYTQETLTNSTILEGASMTKPLFAFAVLRLAERGIIDLDKPLYKYTSPPEDVKNNPWVKLITARMVLNHTTGFPNWAEDTPDGKLNIRFKPGTDVGYSGAGFTYLREAVDAITGKPITQVLQEEVVDVLELSNMYFKNEPGLVDITANGHVFNSARIKSIPEAAEMASSVHTTAKSYAEFIIALSQRKGLKPETYKSLINRTLQRSEHEEAGEICKHYFSLGLSLRDSPFFGLSFGHSGSNGDFKCTSTMYEDTKNGFVVMTNAYTGQMLQFHLHNLLNIGTKQVDP